MNNKTQELIWSIKRSIFQIRRFFRRYQFDVDHVGEGYFEYDEELFKIEKPHLEKVIRGLRKRRMLPRVGDQIYGDDNVFYVKEICFFRKMACIYVDDEQNRIIEEI